MTTEQNPEHVGVVDASDVRTAIMPDDYYHGEPIHAHLGPSPARLRTKRARDGESAADTGHAPDSAK